MDCRLGDVEEKMDTDDRENEGKPRRKKEKERRLREEGAEVSHINIRMAQATEPLTYTAWQSAAMMRTGYSLRYPHK